MAGFELDFIAVDQASPVVQKLSRELLQAAQRSDRFGGVVTKASQQAEAGLRKIPPAATSAAASMGTLKSAAGQLFQAITGLGGAVGIIIGIKNAVQAASQEEESLRRLAFAVEANKESWEGNREAVTAFAAEQQRLTRFSDTETFEALGKLIRAGSDLGGAMDGVRIAFGLAEQSGKDVNFILDQLAFLIAGETRSLFTLQREFGGFIGDATTAQGVFTNLGKSFRGSAETSQSFEKTLLAAKNELGDFLEDIGRGITFLIGGGGLVEALSKVLDFIRKMGTGLAGVAALGVESAATLGRAFAAVAQGNLRDLPQIVKEGRDALARIITENARQIEEIERRRLDNVEKFEGRIQELKAGTSKQERLNAEREAKAREEAAVKAQETLRQLQIERLDLSDQELEAARLRIEDEKTARLQALEELRQKNLITQEEFLQAQENIKNIAILKFQEAKEGIKANLSEVEQFAKQMSEKVAGQFGDAVADMILEGKSLEESMKGIFNSIIRELIRVAVQAAVTGQAIGGISPAAGGLLAFGAIAAPALKGIFKFQEGGIVRRPTLGILGERGPEAVIPLGKAAPAGNVQVTVQQTNHFTATGLSDEQVRQIMRRISDITRSGAADGAELVKSILAKQGRFAGEAV